MGLQQARLLPQPCGIFPQTVSSGEMPGPVTDDFGLELPVRAHVPFSRWDRRMSRGHRCHSASFIHASLLGRGDAVSLSRPGLGAAYLLLLFGFGFLCIHLRFTSWCLLPLGAVAVFPHCASYSLQRARQPVFWALQPPKGEWCDPQSCSPRSWVPGCPSVWSSPSQSLCTSGEVWGRATSFPCHPGGQGSHRCVPLPSSADMYLADTSSRSRQ